MKESDASKPFWRDVRYFSESELACQCKRYHDNEPEFCGGQTLMDPQFVLQLDEFRRRCGFALTVTSPYRCPAWNRVVSSTGDDGPHTVGLACDLWAPQWLAPTMIPIACEMFSGIGLNLKGEPRERFIHVDIVKRMQPLTVWTY